MVESYVNFYLGTRLVNFQLVSGVVMIGRCQVHFKMEQGIDISPLLLLELFNRRLTEVELAGLSIQVSKGGEYGG